MVQKIAHLMMAIFDQNHVYPAHLQYKYFWEYNSSMRVFFLSFFLPFFQFMFVTQHLQKHMW